MEGWYGRLQRLGFFDPDEPVAKFTKRSSTTLLDKARPKIKVDGVDLAYEAPVPRIQKSILSEDVEAMQPHIRAFVEPR